MTNALVLKALVILVCCSITYSVDCFTCSVDFRSEPFDQTNTCLFPPKDGKGKTSCSSDSKYCQGIITRINGVFVQIQRTCEADCQEYCTEKGFGIETSECRFCCNDSVPYRISCGIQGYKSGAPLIKPDNSFPVTFYALCLLYELLKYSSSQFRLNP